MASDMKAAGITGAITRADDAKIGDLVKQFNSMPFDTRSNVLEKTATAYLKKTGGNP